MPFGKGRIRIGVAYCKMFQRRSGQSADGYIVSSYQTCKGSLLVINAENQSNLVLSTHSVACFSGGCDNSQISEVKTQISLGSSRE